MLAAVMVHRSFDSPRRDPQCPEHAAAYVELFGEEAAAVATHLKRQVSLQLVGAGLLAGGVVLGGVAVMLWASFRRWIHGRSRRPVCRSSPVPLHCVPRHRRSRAIHSPLQRQLAADADAATGG